MIVFCNSVRIKQDPPPDGLKHVKDAEKIYTPAERHNKS